MLFFGGEPIGLFNHDNHKQDEKDEEQRHDAKADCFSEYSVERRHEGGADVGACHLDADDCSGILCSEVRRGRMNNARINGRKAESDQNKGNQCDGAAER